MDVLDKEVIKDKSTRKREEMTIPEFYEPMKAVAEGATEIIMTMEEEKREYKCKYCGEVFDKPLLLARHIKTKHKKAKTREKAKVERETVSEEINKAIEAVGILKGLQASPHLSEGEKKILGDVSMKMEELISYIQRSE